MIATELWEALCQIRVPGEAEQVLKVVIRKTYGFKKKSDVIAISQIMKATGLTRGHVVRGRDKLLAMNMITVTKRSQKGRNEELTYSFQKDYDLWRSVPKKVRGTQGVPKKVAKRSNMGTTIDTLTKERREEGPSLGQLDLNDKPKPKKKKKRKESWVAKAGELYCKLWKEFPDNNGSDYQFKYPKHGGMLKPIRDFYGDEGLMRMIKWWFEITNPFVSGKIRTVELMVGMKDTIAAEIGLQKQKEPTNG